MVRVIGGAHAAHQCCAAIEHVIRAGNVVGVPIAAGVDGGQGGTAMEHADHAGHIGGVPGREVNRREVLAELEHIVCIRHPAGVDLGQVDARTLLEILEQFRAVAGEADLVGGSDTLDVSCSHVAAPLVVLVELAPNECQ